MFAKKPNPEVTELNAEITRVLAQMGEDTPESKEYAAMADQLVKLYAQKKEIPSNRFSKDQMLAVAGNLAGILAIIAYEQHAAFISKATGFITKATR